MTVDQTGGVCRYNQNILCMELNCSTCGWNPVVSSRRLELFLKKNGIKRQEPQKRLIDAMDASERIRTGVLPMVEAGCSPWGIYAEVMKCLNACTAVDTEPIRCQECAFSREAARNGSVDSLVCQNADSPCNRRKVPREYYCPYGERKDND